MSKPTTITEIARDCCPVCCGSGVDPEVDLRHQDIRFCPSCDGDGSNPTDLPLAGVKS